MTGTYIIAFVVSAVATIFMSLLKWGTVYQGCDAVFRIFHAELFQTRSRVSAVAISQDVGTTITALLPVTFAIVAPPGSENGPFTVAAIALGVMVIAAWSSREAYRVHTNKPGHPGACRFPGKTTIGCWLRRSRARG